MNEFAYILGMFFGLAVDAALLSVVAFYPFHKLRQSRGMGGAMLMVAVLATVVTVTVAAWADSVLYTNHLGFAVGLLVFRIPMTIGLTWVAAFVVFGKASEPKAPTKPGGVDWSKYMSADEVARMGSSKKVD